MEQLQHSHISEETCCLSGAVLQRAQCVRGGRREGERVGHIEDAALGDVEAEQVEGDGSLLHGDGAGTPAETMSQGPPHDGGGRSDTVTHAVPHRRWCDLFFFVENELVESCYSRLNCSKRCLFQGSRTSEAVKSILGAFSSTTPWICPLCPKMRGI